MLEKLRTTFSKNRTTSDHPVPVDPASRQFGHEGNRELFDYFRSNSCWDSKYEIYERRARPGLAKALDDLSTKIDAGADVRRETIYGRRVAANAQGLVFAWVGGTSDFFFKLRDDRVEVACRDGARRDQTYPRGWLNFYVTRLGADWAAVVERWFKISYRDSLSKS